MFSVGMFRVLNILIATPKLISSVIRLSAYP